MASRSAVQREDENMCTVHGPMPLIAVRRRELLVGRFREGRQIQFPRNDQSRQLADVLDLLLRKPNGRSLAGRSRSTASGVSRPFRTPPPVAEDDLRYLSAELLEDNGLDQVS